MVEVIALFSNPSVNPRFERFLQIEGTFQGDYPRPVSTAPPARQRHRRLETGERQQLLADYAAGVPVQTLCDQYEITRTTVLDHARRGGMAQRYPKLSGEEVAQAVTMYIEGKSLLTIGNHFGVANTTVRRALVGARIEIRPRQ